MIKLLKKFLIPHKSNSYHPHSTRHYSLATYALLFALSNYVLFPLFGINAKGVSANNLDTEEIINLVNKDREELGLKRLEKNTLLSEAALAKGNDMLAKGYWSHIGPNNETPWQFISQSGYSYIYAGENLAKDFYSNIDVVQAWMNSPTHRENILKSEFNEIGLAVVKGNFQGKDTTLIVQMFGSRENNSEIDYGLTSPVITSPSSNISVENPKTVISGNSKSGDSIKVYSNDKLIGELPKEGGSFTGNINLKNNKNIVYVRSYDNEKKVESPKSNEFIAQVKPNISPDLENINIKVNEDNDRFIVSLVNNLRIFQVKYYIDEYSGEFTKEDNEFVLYLDKANINDFTLKVQIYEDEKNYLEKNIILHSANEDAVVLGTASDSSSAPVPTLLNKTSQLSTIQKFNLTFLLFITLFVLVDLAVVIKKKLHRDHTSYHSFNLGILLIMIITIVSL